MKVLSCHGCGVLLNVDHMNFKVDDKQGVIKESSVWNGERYVATSPYPVCSEVLLCPLDETEYLQL